MTQLIFLALSTFISEDLACIGAGVLVAQRQLSFTAATLACLAGIVLGDLLLFASGRFLRRFISAAPWNGELGLSAIIVARFTPGTRLPIYVAVGSFSNRLWTIIGYFILASALWTPLLVGGTALVGRQAIERSLIYAPLLTLPLLLRYIKRWEFWPSWAIYLPMVPYLVYLAIKHRSCTVFMQANPGIPKGGLIGESKSQILEALNSPDAVAPFKLVYKGEHPTVSTYPVVLKPDVGQRGSGVAIIRSESELNTYFDQVKVATILQEYIPGVEFGIFYIRRPNEVRGHVISITEKRFPTVMGDGKRTLKKLILDDQRAHKLASVYLKRHADASTRVPAEGEVVQLVDIGSHSRGAIFLNGERYWTPQLERRIDEISRRMDGFYLGRFDVRANSIQELQRGNFHILELNGVSAEPTHIYDPSVSLLNAYRALFRQWRIAFEIGAENHTRALNVRLTAYCPRPLSEI